MNVIDISDRLFTVTEKEELKNILRLLAEKHDIDETQYTELKQRAGVLLKKAGGPEKFFKNAGQSLEDILS